MTEPAAPAPEGSAPLQPLQAWPPQEVPPPWPVRRPGPPQWPAQQGPAWQPPAPAPRRDSTRVIAIVALVLSGVTLVGMALTTLVPLLFFGLFASFAGEGFDDGTLFPSVSTSFGGEVTPAADGSVAGATLAAAVTRLARDDGMEPAGPLTCDPVPHVAGGVSVLCRAADPAWFGIVRFTSTDGSFQLTTVGSDGGPIP